MAIPHAGLTLHGTNNDFDATTKRPAHSAILCKIDDDTIHEVQQASNAKKPLLFISGSVPTLRIGTRTIDLTLSAEDFRHELYSASLEPFDHLHFAGLVSYRAELKESSSSEGGDAALAALQSSLASHQQEKKTNSTVITNTILPPPKNRHDAAREQRQASRRNAGGAQSSSQDAGRVHPSPSQTSIPQDRSAAKFHAMRTSIVHLLAIKPLTRNDVQSTTRIPRQDLDDVLQRVGTQQTDGKWALMPRAYKELDVWKFRYHSQEDRQLAIDNAVKAYDRQRLGKDDKEWQMLLPKEERGKGKVLSKLLSIVSSTSPMAHAEIKGGAATTPKIGAAKGDAAVSRLFSKDPKKARAMEEAKGKKRKEREALASASDRDSGKPAAKKRQVAKVNNPKIKSQEIVHSSADEDSAEESAVNPKPKGNATTKSAAILESKAVTNARKAPASSVTKPSPRAKPALLADGKKPPAKAANGRADAPNRKLAAPAPSPTVTAKTLSRTKNTVSAAAARSTGKATPNILSAQSAHRTQNSPQASGTRPTVPSPLGAARPRGTSNVALKSAAPGAQRSRLTATTSKPTPTTTNGVKKHQDQANNTSTTKMNGNSHVPEHTRNANGVTARKAPATNGSAHPSSSAPKRKYEDSPQQDDEDASAAKHRKTHSSGTVGSSSRSKSPSGSPNSIIDNVSFKQAVELADQYQKYYPKYEKLYDELEARTANDEPITSEERATLLKMHDRLKQLKAEIRAGSHKDHLED